MKPIHILGLRDAKKVGGPEKTVLDTAGAIDSARFRFTPASICEGTKKANEFLAICDILKHPEKGDFLGRAGKELVETEFDIKSRTRKLEHLYELVIEGESKQR